MWNANETSYSWRESWATVCFLFFQAKFDSIDFFFLKRNLFVLIVSQARID